MKNNGIKAELAIATDSQTKSKISGWRRRGVERWLSVKKARLGVLN